MKLTSLVTATAGIISAELVWTHMDVAKQIPSEPFDFKELTSEVDFSGAIPKRSYWTSSPIERDWNNDPRPYEGIHEAGLFTWTAIDGKKPGIIQFLATNPEMFRRLCEQNRYVLRRQFVYVSPEFNKVAEEIYSGKRKELKLPGFDGEQLPVVVDSVDTGVSQGISVWSGHLLNDPEATVLASSEGSDLLHLEVHLKDRQMRYETREVGEWIIQEIDLKALKESTLPAVDRVASKEDAASFQVLAAR